MRVVLCSRHSSELAGGYQLTHQNACPSLDALSAVVGEGEGIGVELDAVAIDTADGARTYYIIIEAFFLQGIVLG